MCSGKRRAEGRGGRGGGGGGQEYIQWNFSIVDTTGPRKCVLVREVSLFQRLTCTQRCAIGTSETVLIRKVSFKRGSTVYV